MRNIFKILMLTGIILFIPGKYVVANDNIALEGSRNWWEPCHITISPIVYYPTLQIESKNYVGGVNSLGWVVLGDVNWFYPADFKAKIVTSNTEYESIKYEAWYSDQCDDWSGTLWIDFPEVKFIPGETCYFVLEKGSLKYDKDSDELSEEWRYEFRIPAELDFVNINGTSPDNLLNIGLRNINEATFYFGRDFIVSEDVYANLYVDDCLVRTMPISKKVDTNKKVVGIIDAKIECIKGIEYRLEIPEGAFMCATFEAIKSPLLNWTFGGQRPAVNNLLFKERLINGDTTPSNVSEIYKVEYAYARPVNVIPGKDMTLCLDGAVVKGVTPQVIEKDDMYVLTAEFGGMKLEHDGNYTIELPANTVFTINDGLLFNPALSYSIPHTSGVEELNADDSRAEYYNLQGVRVDNLHKGLLIRVEKGKATKVMVE